MVFQINNSEKTNYNSTWTEWNLWKLVFTKQNNGLKLVYDQLDTVLAYMCFSNIILTNSVYKGLLQI